MMKIKFAKQQSFTPPKPKIPKHPLGRMYWSDIHTGEHLKAGEMSRQQIEEALKYMQTYKDQTKDFIKAASWVDMFEATLSYMDKLKHRGIRAQHES